MSRQRTRAGLLIAIAAAVVCALVMLQSNVQQRLTDARRALARRQPAAALEIAADILREDADHPEALMIAARAAADTEDYEQAVAFCRRVPEKSPDTWLDAKCLEGEICLTHLRQLRSAEEAFRQALGVDPDNVTALEQLSFILSLQTRVRELIPVQLRLLQNGAVSLDRVVSLVQSDLLYPDDETLNHFHSTNQRNAGLLLAQARIAGFRSSPDAVRELLEQAVRLNPQLAEAQVRLGRILQAGGSREDFELWKQSLPESVFRHPDAWNILGEDLSDASRWEAAAHCFREAGRRDGGSRTASYRLGQTLVALGRQEDAGPFLDRARALERYGKIFDRGQPTESSNKPFHIRLQENAALAESLGLLWEAFAFATLVLEHDPARIEMQKTIERLRPLIATMPLSRTASDRNPFHALDLADTSVPDFRDDWTSFHTRSAQTTAASSATFSNVADEAGFYFRFHNGTDGRLQGAVRPYDFTGGGIGVVDLDADSWPDIFCSQGGDVLIGDNAASSVDRIFRNQRGTQFTDVSNTCLPLDGDFGQGVSAGDYNLDGFVDIFVGNLGRNRLLRNNGDGTFSDVTHQIDHDAGRWTTSCLICDVNSDGIPDLYSVNYLSGDIVDRVCRDSTGRIASCAPQDFPASQDQLHLGTEDGRFVDVTKTSGIERPDGKGLGILVADINDDNTLEVLIANDGVPNFCFGADTESAAFQLAETAMTRGLAVNRDGKSEACMGIAAEDFDQDGNLDFVVTNFMDETNTFYRSSSPDGFFEDRTRQYGLAESSLKRLGFGVQAIDGNLDGRFDLIVANGHVDDFRDRNVPWQMQAAYYQNTGAAGFRELSSEVAGAYFSRLYLGRSIARIDWNRDGAEEAVTGHLLEPYGLLKNTTPRRGSYLKIYLSSSKLRMENPGTVVAVTADGTTWRRQLVAGDGYQAGNERVLTFGLGQAESVDRISIHWRNGRVDTYSDVPINAEIAVREGRKSVYPVPQ